MEEEIKPKGEQGEQKGMLGNHEEMILQCQVKTKLPADFHKMTLCYLYRNIEVSAFM